MQKTLHTEVVNSSGYKINQILNYHPPVAHAVTRPQRTTRTDFAQLRSLNEKRFACYFDNNNSILDPSSEVIYLERLNISLPTDRKKRLFGSHTIRFTEHSKKLLKTYHFHD